MKQVVLYQPEYQTPHIFNLHDRGLFKDRPFVTSAFGARVVAAGSKEIFLQARELKQETIVDPETGRRFFYKAEIVTVQLTQKLTVNKRSLNSIASDSLQAEVLRVYDDWFANHLPRRKDGKLDRARLNAQIERRGIR